MSFIESPYEGSSPSPTAAIKPHPIRWVFLTNIFILSIIKKKENMSRLTEIKNQYPELNITIIDLFNKIDGTKSYKYLPLLCKLFGQRFSSKLYSKDERSRVELDLQTSMMECGVPTNGLSFNEMLMVRDMLDLFNRNDMQNFIQFKNLMEKGLIENKDITSYKNMQELSGAVTLSLIKESEKELENQFIKVFDDETWLVVRPLTFQASLKYGAGTKWCTTYKKEKSYFEKYWRTGILVYFINKKTGYKFAGFKELNERGELTFWDSADIRIDYLEIDIDVYMMPIIKEIFKSPDSNKNLCSDEIQSQVHKECIEQYNIMNHQIFVDHPDLQPVEEYNMMLEAISNELGLESPVPTMRA